jgi:transcriptional regulator with XRE-family HTH domain
MQRAPHERLRELREKRFRSQKAFCSYAHKYGYEIALRRYGGIERGDVAPGQNEIIVICRAMHISADSWLFGYQDVIDTRLLSEAEMGIVRELVKGLVSLR